MSDNTLVFIIDDEPYYHRLIKHTLKPGEGFEVKFFLSGEEAIEAMDEKPTVVFCDYYLEGMNGIEVLSKLKEIDPEVKVIMVTSEEKEDFAADSLKYGAYSYIVKDNFALKRIKAILREIDDDDF